MNLSFVAALAGSLIAASPTFAGQNIAIPEPTSLGVVAAGAVALAIARLRRGK